MRKGLTKNGKKQQQSGKFWQYGTVTQNFSPKEHLLQIYIYTQIKRPIEGNRLFPKKEM